MTKAEERKTLDKIAALIESAGPDSYIAAAFTGCVAMASENIDNDFMDSWYDRANRKQDELTKTAEALHNFKISYELAEEERKELFDLLREAREAIRACSEIVGKCRDRAAAHFQALDNTAGDDELLEAAREMKSTKATSSAALDAYIKIDRRIGKA